MSILKLKILWSLVLIICISTIVQAQTDMRWQPNELGGIEWVVSENSELPYDDHISMSGQKVDLIYEWKIDEKGHFSSEQLIRWPLLRTIPNDTHASLQRRFKDESNPRITVDGRQIDLGKAKTIQIHGKFSVKSVYKEGVELTRTTFPSTLSPAIIELNRVRNTTDSYMKIAIPNWKKSTETEKDKGVLGIYIIDEFITGEGEFRLAPQDEIEFSIVRTARKLDDSPYFGNHSAELAARNEFIEQCEEKLILETPDPILNQLFKFSKIRATESIFSTRGGLMHGPGGYNKYLAAIWANDQAEYVNPFFPFLGDIAGNESALNSFLHFARFMNEDYKPIPSSIVAEGIDFWNGAGDRGDMAMIAYGASRFALASGNKDWSNQLWPLIEWCLEFSRRKITSDGVVASDSDELEGRFPAGDANLCTSSLYYDALISAAYLADELGKDKLLADSYKNQANKLRKNLTNYFSAEVEGFETYRYYDGNTELRSWICVPLTVGIYDRAPGTIDALFSPQLWTESGLLTKARTTTVWDRSTLYALRGVLESGNTEIGLKKLQDFSKTRLLGEHVPYVIEAYPEQNQSHLSAESGLYCRIFTEGMFGIRPTGLNSFDCTPRLPKDWDKMALKKIQAFGMSWDLEIQRKGKNNRVLVKDANGGVIYDQSLPSGSSHDIQF